MLLIPLDEDEVKDIIASLSHNKSLIKLLLSKTFHSKYISNSEAQNLDARIHIF